MECSSETRDDGKRGCTFWMGRPFSNPFQNVLVSSAKLRNWVDFVRERLEEKKQGKRYGSGMVKA